MSRKAVVAATAVACLVGVNADFASAQQVSDAAATTPGGDVTADEASVLPPVVVNSPNQPIQHRAQPKRKATSVSAPALSASPGPSDVDLSGDAIDGVAGGAGAFAGDGVPGIATGAFTLGQLDMIGGGTITNEAMFTFNKQGLGNAVGIMPGVTWASTGAPSINSSGSRNEGDILVRGFNRFQVPLSIDGVRIYLPADNRLDMNRFVTGDLAEVQVQKGYVSVLNGPGGMGGAINLVSRKPTKEVELEGRVGAVLDGDLGDVGTWSSYAYAGTRQKGYYAQISGTIVDRDHFNMSDDFKPYTPTTGYIASYPYEDGGDRDRSNAEDWRVNVKAGITPNATDEYSINYTTQKSEKGAPLHTDRLAVQGYFNLNGTQTARFWDWPQWDLSTLSWLSKTQIGEASYIKTNTYYNTFENVTRFFPNEQYLYPQVDSPYDDNTFGGFVEVGTKLIPMNTLKGVIHYRQDEHTEGNINYNPLTGAVIGRDPEQTAREETWSFAVENTFHATRQIDIVTGVSYDMNAVLRQDKVPNDPKPELEAWNGQAAAIYNYSDTGRAHASVSSRARFPTLFERYSTRFGSKSADPTIPEERSTNYEIGISETFFGNLRLSSAIFYSDIEDSIQNAFVGPNGMNSIIGISADGETYGLELQADLDVMPGLRVGGNYTYIERSLDFASAAQDILAKYDSSAPPPNLVAAVEAMKVEGMPRHEAFLYVSWKPFSQLTLTPSLEIASDRTALITSCRSTLPYGTNMNPNNSGQCTPGRTQAQARPNYAQIGSYAMVNFQAAYDFDANTTATFGVTNMLDQNYSLAEGFPEPGRQFFVNLRSRF
ncbi:MAG: TonB-dependent receptor [Hyphomicrobium sp.]|nr:TonB-dependent receptor [Hyphomicrobium sp.]